MACFLPLPRDLQMLIAREAQAQARIDAAHAELRRQVAAWCKIYWEYVSLVMYQDEEYMAVKRTLPEPSDPDDHDAWQDYLMSDVGADEQEFLDSDTFEARHAISPCDWMRGVRPIAWAFRVPWWASQYYDGNLFF